MEAGIYLGLKAVLPAADLAAGDYVVVIDASANDVRLVDQADYLALAGGGSGLPAADDTDVIEGASDATKVGRFDVSANVPTATTVTLSFPGADGTIATLENDQAWSGTQTFGTVMCSSVIASSNVVGAGGLFTGSVSCGASVTSVDGDFSGTVTADKVTITGTPSAGTDAITKSYADALVTGLLDFKGATDASGSPNYPSASKGDCYVVSVAGKVGGASGKGVDVGDVYLATADNAGGTEASVGTSWVVLEHNLVGALLSANNLSDLASASTARTNLGLGTAATQNTGTSGTTVPLLDGANTWSGNQSVAALLNVRQSGGVAGTDEGRISHDGTNLVIRNMNSSTAVVQIFGSGSTYATVEMGAYFGVLAGMYKAGLRSNSTFVLANDIPIVWSSTADATGSASAMLHRAADGVVKFCGSSTSTAGGFSAPSRTPSQITSDQNNYSPGVGMGQRWSSDASRTVTGMAAGQDMEPRWIWNVGAQNIVLSNESASSTAANRFTTATGADLTLAANKCALAFYDATSSRWRVTLLP